MRFKIDENLPQVVATLLQDAGHDSTTVVEQGLRGAIDPNLAAVCRGEQRVFITLDLGFADIRQYPPEDFIGIVVLRLGSQAIPHVLAALRRILPLVNEASLRGRLWIVEETRVRIRGGDA